MGLMDALKKNFTQGGISIQVIAEPVIPTGSPYTFTARVTAKDSVQKITNVRATVEREEMRTRVSTGYGNNNMQNRPRRDTVARVENTEAFSLNAGEQRDVQLTLNMQEPSSGGLFGKVSSAIRQVNSLVGGNSGYTYTLVVTADVEGVVMDPTQRVLVQVVEGSAPTAPTPPTQPPTA